MHLRNLEGTEDFHVPTSTGKALLETGKFVEIKPTSDPPKQETQWTIIHRTEGSPILRAYCPNCKAEATAAGERAPYTKLFHVCFGAPESCPYEITREYFDARENWKKGDKERADRPKPKRPGFAVQVG